MKKGDNQKLLLDTLAACGPCLARELVERTDLSPNYVSKTLIALGQEIPSRGRLVHIAEWVRTPVDGVFHLRALFAIGDKPNAEKPDLPRQYGVQVVLPTTPASWISQLVPA